MKIAVVKEGAELETRVAASPDVVKKMLGLGVEVIVQKDAGLASGFVDDAYKAVGAQIGKTHNATVKGSEVVLKVRGPSANECSAYDKGTVVISTMDPFGHEERISAMAKAGITGFAMEFMPRITRAQVMDVLSSQANLAGYRAVIDGAATFGRALPMMMTAAGTVPAARVFVMGAGVAGLQAIATAKRLGAVVTATDVRPAAKEQVESLGGKFIAVENEEFKQAETAGGYAKEMSDDYRAKQAELVKSHIAKQDIVITTALIPGRPAPKLVSKEMVESMQPGSVIVDLALERGGNCEVARAGEDVNHQGVIILGHINWPGRIAQTASQLYGRNLFAFLETLFDKENKKLSIDFEDELVKATLVTRDGSVVHPSLKGDK